MLEYGLDIVKYHVKNGIKEYLGDQEVISLSLKKYKNISKGLYTLPLYTVGIPPEKELKSLCLVHPIHCDKELSFKERLLYYNDENNYYTSSTNRYIKFSRKLIYENKSEAFEICKKYNLILILPDQLCKKPYCFYKMKNSFGDASLTKSIINNGINIRESISFLKIYNISIFNIIIIFKTSIIAIKYKDKYIIC